MSVPYHLELFNSGRVRIYVNFSNIKSDVADEKITMHVYATDRLGTPIFTEQLGIQEIRLLHSHLDSISVIKNGAKQSAKFVETTEQIKFLLTHIKEQNLP